MAILVALRRPDLVRGIVGIGSDPDFTEDLLWPSLSESDQEAIMTGNCGEEGGGEGILNVPWGKRGEEYPITRSLIVDGRENLVLRGGKDSLDVNCPVRLVHDLDDPEVPPMTSMRLAEAVRSDDVVLVMPKGGIKGIEEAVEECFEAAAKKG